MNLNKKPLTEEGPLIVKFYNPICGNLKNIVNTTVNAEYYLLSTYLFLFSGGGDLQEKMTCFCLSFQESGIVWF